jgi:hypothetical protein
MHAGEDKEDEEMRESKSAMLLIRLRKCVGLVVRWCGGAVALCESVPATMVLTRWRVVCAEGAACS